ncbi:MAG: hypothetical protein R3181_07975, partial [Rubricoccaceae bacterium]|nr:hypothetical protein [Rubricoccaceae bacterium]
MPVAPLHRLVGILGVLVAALLASPASAQSYDATVDCSGTPTGHIDWPADDPIWSFDYVRGPQSTGRDGSGLELRNVYYEGRLVFRQAHVPILNVEYDGSGCSCFRDWSDEEAGFATDGIRAAPQNCFADATAGAVETTCDRNLVGGTGGDTGSFEGVAVEDYGDELVLTTHLRAGWYRYRIKWHFYADGRVWPEYSFSAASAVCTENSHRHHAYWRFDFDLDGSDGERVREINPTAGTSVVIETEAARTWGDPADGGSWEITDDATGLGYEIIPSSADLELPVDSFSKLDALVVRHHPNEIDDNGFTCAINQGRFLNGEGVAGQDVVFWYRSGALHTAGNPWECDIVGPTLVPVGLGTAAEPDAEGLPEGYELERAQPNPFNPSTTVRFRVAEAQRVSLALYDALGRRVATLHEGYAE